MPFKNRPGRLRHGSAPSIRAVKYDVTALNKEIAYLLAQDCEIGVHGIDSWLDAGQACDEIARIRAITGQSALGVRMHWLYGDAATPARLEQAGYCYDSTCGYNEHIGYRAGTTQVYRPPGANHLLELPLHIMDTALFYPNRMGLALRQGIAAVQPLIAMTQRFGGVLTLNWHDRSIAPERLWGEVYAQILNELHQQNARFMTAGEVVGWFAKRRAIRFWPAADGLDIRLSGQPLTAADGMTLRVYSPGPPGPVVPEHVNAPYRDFLLVGHGDLYSLN